MNTAWVSETVVPFSFFLPILEAQVKTVPLMPDQRYDWLSDQAWRTRNDAFFGRQ